VTNIHLAADALNGAVVEPGANFSLNGRLGPRTKAKGYVDAGVIYDGVMATDVGGGVSQLTTTLFNAAFFAGMELKSYQSHTIYIDRYPYGREATISYPSPDFVFRNPSPYGLLLWTSYDDTSITVSIYSTRWATGDQTGQTKEPYGPCTKVKTERTLTFANGGRKQVDYVTAVYQPSEGVTCFGAKPADPREGGGDSNKGGNGPANGNGNGNGKNDPAPPAGPPSGQAAPNASTGQNPVR
jgi:vancomycin resistance protein YoaR